MPKLLTFLVEHPHMFLLDAYKSWACFCLGEAGRTLLRWPAKLHPGRSSLSKRSRGREIVSQKQTSFYCTRGWTSNVVCIAACRFHMMMLQRPGTTPCINAAENGFASQRSRGNGDFLLCYIWRKGCVISSALCHNCYSDLALFLFFLSENK